MDTEDVVLGHLKHFYDSQGRVRVQGQSHIGHSQIGFLTQEHTADKLNIWKL